MPPPCTRPAPVLPMRAATWPCAACVVTILCNFVCASCRCGGLWGKHLTRGWPRMRSSQDGDWLPGSGSASAVCDMLSKNRPQMMSRSARTRDGAAALKRKHTMVADSRCGSIMGGIIMGSWGSGMGAGVCGPCVAHTVGATEGWGARRDCECAASRMSRSLCML